MTQKIEMGGKPGYLRIATEEAFSPPEMMKQYLEILDKQGADADPGFRSLWGFYGTSPSPRATAILERLQDVGDRRLADMDATGIDKAILSLTSPGTQILDKDAAVAMSVLANDQLADAVAKHPDRFYGLAAMAPQDPAHAAREIERGITKLGFKGVILNSHTHGEYMDDPKFWPIFEAAEALDVPIYLHPNTPSKRMIEPLLEAGLDGAVFGFGVETGMHLLRIIVAGVFDRFPNLKIIVGHMGEALPYWMFRLDYMHGATVRSNRYDFMKPLKKQISDYMKENVYITSSGMQWEPAVKFAQEVLGKDRVMYSMDYPYEYVAEEVIAMDNMNMPLEDKKMFFQSNAERVFKL